MIQVKLSTSETGYIKFEGDAALQEYFDEFDKYYFEEDTSKDLKHYVFSKLRDNNIKISNDMMYIMVTHFPLKQQLALISIDGIEEWIK